MPGLFKRLRHRWGAHPACKGECAHPDKPCDILANVPTEGTAVITCNSDHKTVERGLYNGVQVKVLRNEETEPNLVVAVGDARYVLDRRIARRIRVRTEQ